MPPKGTDKPSPFARIGKGKRPSGRPPAAKGRKKPPASPAAASPSKETVSLEEHVAHGDALLARGDFAAALSLFSSARSAVVTASLAARRAVKDGAAGEADGEADDADRGGDEKTLVYTVLSPAHKTLFASLLNKTGCAYKGLGHLDDAAAALKDAVSLYAAVEAARGEVNGTSGAEEEDDAQLTAFASAHAVALSNLAGVLRSQGKMDEALATYEEALAVRRSGATLNNFAQTLVATGDFAKALVVHKDALEERRKELPAKHPYIASSLTAIGQLHAKLGDGQLALEVLASAEAAARVADPPNAAAHAVGCPI